MSTVMKHTSDNRLTIRLTESAKNHLVSHLKKKPEQIGVRLTLKKTGCSGLSYVIEDVQVPNAKDLKMPLAAEYQFYVDRAYYPILHNLEIDYIKQGLNYKLEFNNPNQTGQCGCGESFTVN